MAGVAARHLRGAPGPSRTRARWRELPAAAACAPRPLHPFLVERGSLTRLLRAHGREFRVLRLWQGLHAGPEGPLWTREVLLLLDGVPVVWARSVLPAAALRGPWRPLRGFGTRPLGDWLFQRCELRRGAIELRRLGGADALARAAARALGRAGFGQAAGAAALWARHSSFQRGGCTLELTEVFLPAACALRRSAAPGASEAPASAHRA